MSAKIRFWGVLSLLLSATQLLAATQEPLTGRVVNTSGEAISYATVVVSNKEQAQVAGCATDEDGVFSIMINKGDYRLIISYVGYEEYSREINGTEALGDVALRESVEHIEGVVVTSNLIRREADRFIIDVANAPSAIGKDGEELLKSSPGVWINDDQISIYGSSNPKIFVNDRELKLSSEQVMVYLRNLKSEDVRSIEIIPQSGAEFDASSSSGIIMIYLKRQREAGMMGSVSLGSAHSEYMEAYSPSANINFQSKGLTINTSGWYNYRNSSNDSHSTNHYIESGSTLSNINSGGDISNSGGGKIEAIYEINPNHSIGADFNYFDSSTSQSSTSVYRIEWDGGSSESLGSTLANSDGQNISATFNYIFKVDSLGSTLKFLADYNRNGSDSYNMNIARKESLDSLYNSLSDTKYQISSATLAFEKNFNPKLQLKSGLKYTRNDMDSRSDYTYGVVTDDSDDNLATTNESILAHENIGAAYAIGSARINRVGLVVGLRAEYTSTEGYGDTFEQSYLSLFPNANISYSIDPTGVNLLTAQYSRSIIRPSFWALNPERRQESEYMYQIGNPLLKPSYKNSISLSYTYKYRYNLYLASNFTNDAIQQVMLVDETNPEVSLIRPENMSRQVDYIANLSLPFQITKWWSLNANLTYVYRGEKLLEEDNMEFQNLVIGNVQTTFTLPHKFFIDLSYFGMNDVYSGNILVESRQVVNASVKKRLWGDRFTAALKVNNLFNAGYNFGATTSESIYNMSINGAWTSRFFGASLSYNFKAGREYQQRTRLEGSADASRLESEAYHQ